MKGIKRTTAILVALMLLFGAFAPATARAEEPASIEEPTMEASESETPVEEQTQAEPEEQLPAEGSESKATETLEELELFEGNTPTAQGSAPEDPANIFVLTKRAYNDPNAPEEKIGEYKTLKEAVMGCTQDNLDNLYIITMYGDYMVPDAEKSVERGSLHYLLRSAGASPYTLKKEGTDTVFSLGENNTLEVQNVILDGNNDGQCFFMWGNSEVTLGEGTVVQNFVDILDRDGPAIYMSGNSTLNIEDGVEIKDNKSDRKNGGVIELREAGCTLNINGGTFENNNSTNYFGGVILSFGTVNIKGGTFKGNKARYGGVVASMGTLKITGGTFDKNTAEAYGGVVWANGVCSIDGTQQGVHFTSNAAIKGGGAIYTKADTTITNIPFTSNTTKEHGGAIYRDVNKKGVDTNVVIKNSSFDKNAVSSRGGAIYTKANMTLSNNTFTSNQAKWGGAVATNESSLQQTIEKCTFNANEAQFGGAISLDSNTPLEVKNTQFIKNEAAFGGAITTSSATDTLDMTKSKLGLKDTTFSENQALRGGAVFTSFMTEIEGSKFLKNVANLHPQDNQDHPQLSGMGGAIYVDGVFTKPGNGTGLVENLMVRIHGNTTFDSNKADAEGGAIYTTPCQYKDPINKGHTGNPIEEQKPYENLEIANDTVFTDNRASRSYAPPQNYHEFTNLGFKQNSCADKAHINARYAESILNNFDVNYKNDNKLITYNANGGRFPDGSTIKTKEYPKGERITILDAPKRGGYDFLYWKGSEHHPGDKYTVEDNHTFTAQWEKKPPKPPAPPIIEKIIVDPNGGTFSDGATGRKFFEVAVGKIFHLPSAPTREGYKFIAWKGTDAEYQPDYSYVVKPGGETFVAVWEGEEEPKPAPMPKPRPYVPVPRVSLPVIPTIPKAGAGK